jgi:hypothetical protein
MVYQVQFFQGDVLGLNSLLQAMQNDQGCEIVDVIQINETSFFIKFRTPIGTSWFKKLFA